MTPYVAGSKPHQIGGLFFEPTILINVTNDTLLATEETFGPVAPVFRFSEDAEVIALANDAECGLAACFYARDLSRVFRVAEALEYGMIGINTGFMFGSLVATLKARSPWSPARPSAVSLQRDRSLSRYPRGTN